MSPRKSLRSMNLSLELLSLSLGSFHGRYKKNQILIGLLFEVKEKIKDFLRRNLDSFAWRYEDIKEEVQNLIQNGFIREGGHLPEMGHEPDHGEEI